MKTSITNHSRSMVKEKSWPYQQYYIGERDSENRKCNKGENYWSGAKSLERYSGRFFRDTMHGVGEYSWRYINSEGASITYEGHFFCNRMHGHGTMSYADGRVFDGLFHSNVRWGPGIESHVDLRQNVGLWLGNKLIRLAWKPPAYSLILDLTTTIAGRECVNAHRNLMTSYLETINDRNEPAKLLVKFGLKPRSAEAMWTKLCPKNLTDVTSPAFQLQLFDENYYGSGNKEILVEIERIPKSNQSFNTHKTYFAWNNNVLIKHMMKHTFRNKDRIENHLNIVQILTASREKLKPPAKHELDCRTLLMSSYLGITESVVQLVNNEDVHPDVTDLQGNSVLMYATRGDHPQIIHFLVEAGASINNCNDCCSTPLGVALMRFVCECKGISTNEMTQALIPETSMLRINSSLQNVSEWNLMSDSKVPNKINGPTRTPSKVMKPQMSQKRIKSLMSLKEQFLKVNHKIQEKILDGNDVTGDNYFNESFQLYTNVMDQYISKVVLEYTSAGSGNPISYIFEVEDVAKYIIDNEVDEQKKISEKNPKKVASKALKEFINGKGKLGNGMSINNKDHPQPLNEVDRTNTDTYERILLTINQLLKDGADPSLVRCPQPALFMALSSGCSKLVKQLIDHGANVNEYFPHILGYTILDVAITYPLKNENLDIIRVLLENGADATHRLPYRSAYSTESLTPGPTLLHAVLAKTADTEEEEEIRRHMLELLLTYNCNYLDQFNGRSAIDVAMTKRADIFDIFIKHPKVDLNAIINQSNQSILTKMFSLSYFVTLESKQRLEILTNLLLRGADPLSTCQNEEETNDNVVVYAKKILDGYFNVEDKHSPTASKHSENKARKNGKSNDDKGPKHKTVIGDIDEYKQALELVTDWARRLQIYRRQTKILKELIKTVNKYKHCHWTVILKNIDNKKSVHLWLTPKVGLEIWTTILQRNRRKNNYVKTLLKNLLCILLFCVRDIKESNIGERLSVEEKNAIESEVNTLLREYKNNINNITIETKSWVSAVLIADDTKFNVCFECAKPLNNQKIVCPLFREISFCSDACMKTNFHRNDCHPREDNKFGRIIVN